jgi:hypothetical protein
MWGEVAIEILFHSRRSMAQPPTEEYAFAVLEWVK